MGIELFLFLQLFNSVLRTFYIVLALDSVGYMWTFVIFACIAAAGSFNHIIKIFISEILISENSYLAFVGGFSVLFYPEEITSEHFRDTLELKHTDAEGHSKKEEDKNDAISDIDDGYYSRK